MHTSCDGSGSDLCTFKAVYTGFLSDFLYMFLHYFSLKIDFGAVCIFAAMSGKMFPYNSANIGRGWNEKKMQRERYLSCMEFLTKVHF